MTESEHKLNEKCLGTEKRMRLTGEANGTDTVGGRSTRPMGDQRQFAEVAAFSDLVNLNFNAVFSNDSNANSARLDEVHAVSCIALSDDARTALERTRIQSIRYVHPLVGLQRKRNKKSKRYHQPISSANIT